MSDTNNVLDSVNKVLDIVDHAVATNNYSNMSSQIKNIFKPASQQDLYDSVRRQYGQNKYRGGHMSNAQDYRNAGGNGGAENNGGTCGNGGAVNNGGTCGNANSRGACGNSGAGSSRGVYGNGGAGYARGNGTGNTAQSAAAYASRKTPENPYFKPVQGALGGKVLFGFGIAGLILFGLLTAGVGAFALFSSVPLVLAITRPLSVFFLILTAGSGLMTYFGNKNSSQASHFAEYQKILSPNLYADIDELAKETRLSEKTVVKELKALTASGMIKQGHFDEKETCFIASDTLYSQYQETEKNARALKAEQTSSAAADSTIPADVKAVLDKGNAYIATIRKANDAIADAGVSEKLSRMENIVTKIFAQVRKQPELAHNLNMFMDYYLPTTAKLIGAYEEMDAQPVQGENITSAKKEIEGTLDTINDAFEKLLDSFFKDKALDVSTDISVMKTVLRQQGLTPDDLEAMRMKEAQRKAMEEGPTLDELKKQIDAAKENEQEQKIKVQ